MSRLRIIRRFDSTLNYWRMVGDLLAAACAANSFYLLAIGEKVDSRYYFQTALLLFLISEIQGIRK